MDLLTLRQKHPRLIYHAYHLRQEANDLLLTFDLLLEPDIQFQPKLRLKNLSQSLLKQIFGRAKLDPTLDRLFFHLGLAEIPSYFKAACPAEIVIYHQGQLDEQATAFWHDLLIRGLGEFYYRNQIDFSQADFVKIRLEKTAEPDGPIVPDKLDESNKSGEPIRSSELVGSSKQTDSSDTKFFADQGSPVLIPVGGGKDSSTLLLIMEERRLPYDIFLLAPHAPAAAKIAKLLQQNGHCQNIIEAERSIDPTLIALNQQGYLNGHTPFSAYLAFASTTVAYLHGQQDILLGNEASSEEENLLYLGHKINHQYSKSLDFERKFSLYSQQHLFTGADQQFVPRYTSLLRSLSELEITRKLCELTQAHQRFASLLTTFKSCNVGQQQDRWCHNCPKCAFVFAMLSAYLDEDFVSGQIFSENLFAKNSLEQTFMDLAGFGDKKPFECVGTFAEVREAILLAYQRSTHPPAFLRRIRQRVEAKKLMDKLASKSILILGMGREGFSSLEFLRQHFPDKKIAVADASPKAIADDFNIDTHFGPDYLSSLDQYEIIIKTAGIPLSTREIQEAIKQGSEILSNTQIFFALCEGQIIGITGTKGKSTTSKLTYEILRDAGLKTVLLGNIGEAPLNQLKYIDSTTLVVDELSCHQLAELQDSPHIAIVLDIKSEHLDYYKDFASYFRAKSAIARFQKSDDYLIYNSALEGAASMAALSQAQKITHSLSDDSLSDDRKATVYRKGQQIFYHQGTDKKVDLPEPKPIDKSTDEAIIDLAEIPLLGEHNLYNVMPAIVVAKLLQVDSQSIKQSIKKFRNLAHRLELIAEIDNVKYFDDSIAVNPHATIMAIQSFAKNSVILIAGGYERNQDFTELAKVIKTYGVKYLIALPSTGARLVEFVGRETDIPTVQVATIEAAVARAKTQAQAGDVVLLSPASASYNTFSSYEERGKAFATAVTDGRKAETEMKTAQAETKK